jgi:HlyD family secretion protein
VTESLASDAKRSMRRYLAFGVGLVFLIVFGAGGWALSTELAGAVIAEGQLVVESNKKTIQSPTTGVVAEIRVKDGDSVHAGDILLRLDPTEARASLAIIQKQIDELEARQARLEAEIAGAPAVDFPPSLTARAEEAAVSRILKGEVALFTARRAGREAQKDQYRQQIEQLNEQIAGMQAQVTGKQKEIGLNAKELEKLDQLLRQNLTTFSTLNRVAMDDARLTAELGEVRASIASTKGKISEINLRIIQIDDEVRSGAGTDVSDIRNNLAQLAEKRVAAQEELNRVDIQAPQDGTVHELAFHTVRGVVTAGQPIMSLVPVSDVLAVEARVRPQDIDQIHIGQQADLRFVAFNQRTTPEIQGEVSRISADVVLDTRTGASYYVLRIALHEDQLARLEGLKLIPGMPVEVFVATAPRTAMSYLARPFIDQISRAFRDK